MNNSLLDSLSTETKQKIFECLSQAIGEDRQEADTVLGLKTNVSGPFLNWDLIYRNLINTFSNSEIHFSASKRGMWEVLLLLDKKSGLLLSFMRDQRFETIKKSKTNRQPQYIRALVSLNAELQSTQKQQRLFDFDEYEDEPQINQILDNLCIGFEDPVRGADVKHTLVVFSNQFGRLSSLKAYVLDRDLDIVFEQNWLDLVCPIITNEVATTDANSAVTVPVLKQKSLDRLRRKELVALREAEQIKHS